MLISTRKDFFNFLSLRHIKAIVFDLDDTLFDTFNQIISPLEKESAWRMCQLCNSLPPYQELVDMCLDLRKRNPDNLEQELRETFFTGNESIFLERAGIFKNISLNKIYIDTKIKNLLEELRFSFKLFLMTKGDECYQGKKIEQLNVSFMFDQIFIVKNKHDHLRLILKNYALTSESVLVIGNRIDDEIIAASALNMHTLWVKYGEGSLISSEDFSFKKNTKPIAEIESIKNICHEFCVV